MKKIEKEERIEINEEIRCKKCGYKFLRWRYYRCPNCGERH